MWVASCPQLGLQCLQETKSGNLGHVGAFLAPALPLSQATLSMKERRRLEGTVTRASQRWGAGKKHGVGPATQLGALAAAYLCPGTLVPSCLMKGTVIGSTPAPNGQGRLFSQAGQKGCSGILVRMMTDSLLSHEPRICLLLMRKQKIPDRSGALRPNS